jgi:2,4-dienoyl-CoA reductase-like NADH-dependent reductase (Old Yellow Enzyme family)
MTHPYEHLLAPYQLTPAMTLKNRMVMAPMTRVSATEDHIPTMEMAAYYAKRADAGLIITEATIISPSAKGHKRVPGIFNTEQIKGWKPVAQSIHDRGGRAFMQLWHVGRVSHPVFLDGQLPVSASATTMTGKISRMPELTYGTSREASISEIQQIIQDFAQAAENAIVAGFDGIEIHGANGYLIDQFLHYHTNHRQDDYGATPENMARFALEIVHACAKRIGYDRVSIGLSPGAYLNEITGDMRDAAVFHYLLEQLNPLALAYIHVGNFDDHRIFPEIA